QLCQTVAQSAPISSASTESTPKILLTKTPSVRGLDNFFDLFPDAYLIVIIRDGRALVESGVRSFDWNYENATRRWTKNAQTISNLKNKYKDSSRKLLVLRYEDLLKDEKSELIKVFDFLDLDANRFDFNRAKSLGVIGSSDLKKQGSDVHWEVKRKSQEFNPLERFSNWNQRKHRRFNWIAGTRMTEFGYKLEDSNHNKYLHVFENKLLDSMWQFRRIYSRVIQKIEGSLNKSSLT
ncbi:MAG: sulfotransferase, partial [Cyanobacteria bacterium J06635_13]